MKLAFINPPLKRLALFSLAALARRDQIRHASTIRTGSPMPRPLR